MVIQHTLGLDSAYGRLGVEVATAVATVDCGAAIFLRFSSSSKISFIVFLAGAILGALVQTGVVAAATGEDDISLTGKEAPLEPA